MAEMALCVWLHQPPGALGQADHHNHDVQDYGDSNNDGDNSSDKEQTNNNNENNKQCTTNQTTKTIETP